MKKPMYVKEPNISEDTDQLQDLVGQNAVDIMVEMNRRLEAGEAEYDEYHSVLDAAARLCLAVGIKVIYEFPPPDMSGRT